MMVCKGRFWISVILVAVAGLATPSPSDAALFGLWKTKKKSVFTRQSVVVFPFDQADVSRVPTTYGEYIASDLRSMLGSSDRYSVVLYKERLAPILRAKGDSTLRPADAVGPFTEEPARAARLAQLLASDYYVVGSVDDYQVDTSKKQALITISAELHDAKTGRLIKTLSVTGKTPDNVKSAEEEELRDLAKGDAVNKLSAELLAPKKSESASEDTPASPDSTASAPTETKAAPIIAKPKAEGEKPANKVAEQPAK